MTAVLAINSTNDIYMDSTNNLAMLFGSSSNSAGLDAVAQACTTASQAQLAEMVLFTGQGMPALRDVFNANENIAVYQAALIAALQQISGVLAVQSIVFTKSQNVLSYTAVIQSQYGETTLNG